MGGGNLKGQPKTSEAVELMEILLEAPGRERYACTVRLESAHGRSQGKAFGGRRATPYRQAPLGPFAALIA